MVDKQNCDSVLLIRPKEFRYNLETAENNYYQTKDETPIDEINQKAQNEFNHLVSSLLNHNVEVTVIDNPNKDAPDALFPNNWISFLDKGQICLYPMYAKNRRLERDPFVLTQIKEQFQIRQIIDFSPHESFNEYCEGTGSLIFDHKEKLAYTALSERTHPKASEAICKRLGYQPIFFTAYQTVENKRLPIYHTNVVMSVGEEFVAISLSSIDNQDERQKVKEAIINSGKKIIELTEPQINSFCGNILQIKSKTQKKLIIMSEQAYHAFNSHQLEKLSSYGSIVAIPLYTIEKLGGGSARCMLCEVF